MHAWCIRDKQVVVVGFSGRRRGSVVVRPPILDGKRYQPTSDPPNVEPLHAGGNVGRAAERNGPKPTKQRQSKC
jgi:hypothetical protein